MTDLVKRRIYEDEWSKSATQAVEIASRCAIWLPLNTAGSSIIFWAQCMKTKRMNRWKTIACCLSRQDCTPDGAQEYVVHRG